MGGVAFPFLRFKTFCSFEDNLLVFKQISLLSQGLGDPPKDPSSARQRKPASGGGGSRSGGVRGSVVTSPSSNTRYMSLCRSGLTCASDIVSSSLNSHSLYPMFIHAASIIYSINFSMSLHKSVIVWFKMCFMPLSGTVIILLEPKYKPVCVT